MVVIAACCVSWCPRFLGDESWFGGLVVDACGSSHDFIFLEKEEASSSKPFCSGETTRFLVGGPKKFTKDTWRRADVSKVHTDGVEENVIVVEGAFFFLGMVE